MKQASWQFVEKYYTDDLTERESVESRWWLEWLKEVRGENVLSLGCGPNFYDDAQFFSEVPKDFVGVDLNENNIAFLKLSVHPEINKCKNFLRDRRTKIELFVDNIKEEKKEFIDRFDTIYAIGVLGMFNEEDTIRVFKNIQNYLKPGGRILDIDWTDSRLPKDKLRERESFEWYSKHGPSISRLGELFEQAGFKILRHEVYDVPDPETYNWGKIYGYLGERI